MKLGEVKELPTVTAWPSRGLNEGTPASDLFLPLSARGFWSMLPGLQHAPGCGRQKEGGGQWAGIGQSSETVRGEILVFKEILLGDFPGGPVAKTPHSQRGEPGFDSWSGN